MVTVESVQDRRLAARLAGWSLLGVTLSLLLVHGGAIAVAGERVTGTADIGSILDYYSHAGLLTLYWQHGIGIVLFGAFLVGFRYYAVSAATGAIDRLLIGVGIISAAAVIPLALTELGLQAALVRLAGSGSSGSLLGVFSAWDWMYNGLFYWLEVVWVGAFSLFMLRTRLLPRWVAVWGLMVAGLHVFHSTVLLVGLPDVVTLPGSALFLFWFIVVGMNLVRTST